MSPRINGRPDRSSRVCRVRRSPRRSFISPRSPSLGRMGGWRLGAATHCTPMSRSTRCLFDRRFAIRSRGARIQGPSSQWRFFLGWTVRVSQVSRQRHCGIEVISELPGCFFECSWLVGWLVCSFVRWFVRSFVRSSLGSAAGRLVATCPYESSKACPVDAS